MTSTIKNGKRYAIETAGTYTLEHVICAGYNTGSGNYFDITLPFSINPNLRITQITFNSGSGVFAPNGVINLSGNAGISMQNNNNGSVFLEIRYNSTQAMALPVNVLLNITLTLA